MSRNYLEEASSILKTPAPLTDLYTANPVEVIMNLLNALNYDGGMMSPMIRKAAAYALGQIGEVNTIGHLKKRHDVEPARGVKEAIVAAVSAINIAPAADGHSQMDRCQIIGEVYQGQRPANW